MATSTIGFSLVQLNDVIPSIFSDPADQVSSSISNLTSKVEAARRESQDDAYSSFDYALPLTESDEEAREEFFSNISMLIERQPQNETRFVILSFLAELVAIEQDPNKGKLTDNGKDLGFSFGTQALQTLKEIMPSVNNIKDPFVPMVEDVLVNIMEGMSDEYFIALMPIFIEMCNDFKMGDEILKAFVATAKKHCQVFILCSKFVEFGDLSETDMGVVVVMQGVTYDLPCSPSKAFWQICHLMSLCCQSKSTARIYGTSKVHNLLTALKLKYSKGEIKFARDSTCGECAVHRLMSSLAKSNTTAADWFAMADKRSFILLSLIRDVKQIDDSRKSKGLKANEHDDEHVARILLCMNGILMGSQNACTVFMERGEVNANTYVTNLLKISKNAEQGLLVSAAVDALLTITSAPGLNSVKKTMENECDVAAGLQGIIKNLINNSRNWTSSDRAAMKRSLNLMMHYSQIPEISLQLNSSEFDGYNREEIVFRILQNTEDPAITDEIRLAAAQVLRVIRLSELDKGEISEIVSMLSSVPALVSAPTYDILTNLMYLIFKMAMDTGDEEAANPEEMTCGSAFRDIYATEVVAAVFGNLSRAAEGDMANTEQEVEARKRKFELACIKFLHTAWLQPQLREGLGSSAIVDTLVQVLITEQSILRSAGPIQFEDHQHLFLEQTYVGNDVRNILRVLLNLHDQDIVAFRMYWQLANVLQGKGHDDVLARLHDVADQGLQHYDEWCAMPCGQEIQDMSFHESQLWGNSAPSGDKSNFDVTDATVDDFEELSSVQYQYWLHSYKYKPHRPEDPQKWRSLLEASKKDHRITHLILRDADGALVAFCGGGPVRGNFAAGTGELYGVYLNPMHPDASNDVLQRMLASFSHAMYKKGYRKCIARIHEQERVVFSVAHRIENAHGGGGDGSGDAQGDEDDQNGSDKSPLLRHGNNNGNDNDEDEDGEGENERMKPFLYEWNLTQNVWLGDEAHEAFLGDEGIPKMVHFLNKSPKEALRQFDATTLETSMHKATTIRAKMENFGSVLMEALEKRKRSDEDSGSRGLDQHVNELNLTADDVHSFPKYLESQFRQLYVPRTLTMPLPLWDQQLIGTAEENFLHTQTLAFERSRLLPLPINFGTEEDDMDGLDGLDELDLTHDQGPGGATPGGAAPAHDMSYKRRDVDELSLQCFMHLQVPACLASMLRCFYVLVRGGTHEVRKMALSELRDPLIFHSIKQVATSIDYCIRRSVNDEFVDKYAVAFKLLVIMEEVISVEPKGLEHSLMIIELYEVVKHIIEEIFGLLVALLESRNQGSEDKLHSLRALNRYEEMLLSRTCHVAAVLVNQVSSIMFFEDSLKVPMIVEGNQMCRAHSLKELFTRNNAAFKDNLLVFLAYDMELSSGFGDDDASTIAAGNSEFAADDMKMRETNAALGGGVSGEVPVDPLSNHRVPLSPGEYRDQMRINVAHIIGELMSVDDKYRYDVLSEYNRGRIKAEMSIRPSFITAALRVSRSRQFRKGIETALTVGNVFKRDGEVVLDHAFVEYQSLGEFHLIVLTNHAWYVSRASFDPDIEQLDKPVDDAGWFQQFADLNRRSYRSVSQVVVGLDRQVLLMRLIADGRVTHEVFVNRTIGTIARLLLVFSRYSMDDMASPLVPQRDDFTHRALAHVYARAEVESLPIHSNSGSGESDGFSLEPKMRLRLVTLACIMKGRSRILDRAIVFAETQSGKAHIFVCYAAVEHFSMKSPSKMTPNDPAYREYLTLDEHYALEDLISVTFTNTAQPAMILGFKKSMLTVSFVCDTAREIWKRALKELLSTKNDWAASVLPDMHEKDKHSQKFI